MMEAWSMRRAAPQAFDVGRAQLLQLQQWSLSQNPDETFEPYGYMSCADLCSRQAAAVMLASCDQQYGAIL